jgi:hypothetical protein
MENSLLFRTHMGFGASCMLMEREGERNSDVVITILLFISVFAIYAASFIRFILHIGNTTNHVH